MPEIFLPVYSVYYSSIASRLRREIALEASLPSKKVQDIY